VGQCKPLERGSRINIFCSNMFGLPSPMRVTLDEDSMVEKGIHKICYDHICYDKENNFGYVIPENKYRVVWFFHRTDGPAISIPFNNERLYTFMLNGKNVKIEDLTCDDETKVMLCLKYTYIGLSENGYHRYV
jgi:hypothetical protein